MMLYLYAILDAPVALGEMSGVLHEPLVLLSGPACWLAAGNLAADAAPPHPTADALRTQDAIVRALATRAEAVLPVRFGTSFENETALQMRLTHFNSDHLRAALARVRGCEQMTVRAFESRSETRFESTRAETPLETRTETPPAETTTETPAETRSGTAYLTERAAAASRAALLPALLQPLRAALGPIVRDEFLDPSRHAPLLGAAYHLIARGDADRYRTAIAGLPLHPDVAWRVTGPSPAYAFAKDALS
jgi:Gas vesicle synthesis protein GvpL/GvpF